MRILDRYIRSSVVISIGLVILILLGIESFMEFISELPWLGVGNYRIFGVFAYVGMQLPSELYQLFPIAGFIGSLIGLGRLSSTSELIVMRAAGVSIARIGWAVLKAALILLIFVTVIGEWPAPKWQLQAVKLKQSLTHKTLKLWSSKGLWLHQQHVFIFVGRVLSNTEIKDVTRFDFDDQNHLLSSFSAKKGYLEAGHWLLEDVAMTELTTDQSKVTHFARKPLGIDFQPELLQRKMQRDSDQQSLVGLWNNIRYRHQAGLLANELESSFWQRVTQPLTTVIMICLGVPFVFGSLRNSSMSARVLTGIIVGFIFYMLNQFIGPVALVYQWPAWIAGALPTLLFAAIYTVLLSRIR